MPRPDSTYTDFAHGQVTVGTTAVQLPSEDGGRIHLRPAAANTAPIFIGKSGVTTANGHQLPADDEVIVFVGKLSDLFAISSAITQILTYFVEK